jgi:tRNA threonylcarbamoyladenosine biosynthesis protein TsaE
MSPKPTSTVSETFGSPSADSTEAVGAALAELLQPGDVVLLEGDLAAGKTTLVRGLVCALGGDDADVSSPSFVLLQSYPCAATAISVVHHVDLYRLGEKIADLREIGIEEVLSDSAAVVAVEWPKDALARWIPTDARVWRVVITTETNDARRIEITPPEAN